MIPPEAIANVAASIKQFGFRQPIVVDAKGVIVVGHARRLAALQLGLTKVPVHVAKDLSDKQARAYRLADNRSNEDSSWDRELLAVELKDLGDAAAELTGFDAAELSSLLNEKPEPKARMAEAVKLREKWGTAIGQVWQIGHHRVHCADSREKPLPCDLVCTDPPYDLEADCVAQIMRDWADRYVVLCGDAQAFSLARLFSFSLCFVWKHAARGFPTKNLPLLCHTLVVVLTTRNADKSGWQRPRPDWSSVIECDRDYEHTVMGQGKSSEIFAAMIEGFGAARAIGDPFAGTLSALLACERLGKKFVGCELDPAVLAVGLQRCADAGLTEICLIEEVTKGEKGDATRTEAQADPPAHHRRQPRKAAAQRKRA